MMHKSLRTWGTFISYENFPRFKSMPHSWRHLLGTHLCRTSQFLTRTLPRLFLDENFLTASGPTLRYGKLSTKARRTALIPLACSLHLPSPSLLTIALSLFQSKVANGGGAQDFETAVKCVYWPSTSTHRNIKGALTFFTFCCEVEVCNSWACVIMFWQLNSL